MKKLEVYDEGRRDFKSWSGKGSGRSGVGRGLVISRSLYCTNTFRLMVMVWIETDFSMLQLKKNSRSVWRSRLHNNLRS